MHFLLIEYYTLSDVSVTEIFFNQTHITLLLTLLKPETSFCLLLFLTKLPQTKKEC